MRFLKHIFIFFLLVSIQSKLQGAYYLVPTDVIMIDTNLPVLAGIQPGDTIALESGHRPLLTIRNLKGSSNAPLTIMNHNGVVLISSNHYFGISIRNCQYIHFTGTGSADNYGIKIENIDGAGLGAGSGTSDLEIDHIEINHVNSAGMLIKTNASCTDFHRADFVQKNINIHDNLITHTGTEGLYIGSTFYTGKLVNCNGTDSLIFDPMMENVWVYNNIIDHTGWDGLQVSSATNSEVYNNFITNNSMNNKANQKSGIILGGGFEGRAYNNVIQEGLGNGIAVFANGNTSVYNNHILRSSGSYGLYLNDKVADSNATNFHFVNNLIVSPEISGVFLYLNKIPGSSVIISNNAIYDPGYLQQYEQQNQAIKAYVNSNSSNVIVESNFFRSDIEPSHYADVSSDNYNLNPASPLIDQGKTYPQLQFITEDCDGDLRFQGHFIDIGPQESPFSSSIDEQVISKSFGISLPQPIRNKSSEARIYSKHNVVINLFLVSLNGRREPLFENLSIASGTTFKSFDFSNLPPGMYMLCAEGNEERLLTQKIIVLN